MYVDSGEIVFFAEAATKLYEPYATEIFKKIVREGDTVVDLGANMGYYSLLASRLVGEKGWVFAFEPHPQSYGLLMKKHKVEQIS